VLTIKQTLYLVVNLICWIAILILTQDVDKLLVLFIIREATLYFINVMDCMIKFHWTSDLDHIIRQALNAISRR
jgi:hypothetical protein